MAVCAAKMYAQSQLPPSEGDRMRYHATIELPKGYLSGVCVLLREEAVLKGSFFNEFGISYMDFTYNVAKDKVKLHSVQSMLDKWYIRKMLRHDLRMLMHAMEDGVGEYTNNKRKMTYRFSLMQEDEPVNANDDDTEE